MTDARERGAAVLLIVFNRPDLTRRLVDALRDAKPSLLYLSADGPRPHRPGEAELCAATRAELDRIDWPCRIERKFEAANLGCGPAVASAISWVLDAEGEAIVLEDDCIPHPSFFPFCAELLERYRDDERVMQITGSNWDADRAHYAGASYGFNGFAAIWGWATWARAWQHFDITMARWPEFRDSGLHDGLAGSPRFRRELRRLWDDAHHGGGEWGRQWQFTVYREHGLSITPAVNLISNIGFREDATQTTTQGDDLADIPVHEMTFPLVHPPEVTRNPHIDRVFESAMLRKFGLGVRILRAVVPSLRVRRAIKHLVPGRRR